MNLVFDFEAPGYFVVEDENLPNADRISFESF